MKHRPTNEQAKAITSTGPTLVSASAGTGKTSMIVKKILWMHGLDLGSTDSGKKIPLCQNPVRLHQIAAITFSERGAHNLKEKLREELEDHPHLKCELERTTIRTIHGFAADLLKENALRLGIDPSFRILDSTETEIKQREIVRQVVTSALGQKDPGTCKLVAEYKLEVGEWGSSAIDRVIAFMRELRKYKEAFIDKKWSRPVEGAPWKRVLERKALQQLAQSSDTPGEISLEIEDTLYRLSQARLDKWLNWLERENTRDYDDLIRSIKRFLTSPDSSEIKAIQERSWKRVPNRKALQQLVKLSDVPGKISLEIEDTLYRLSQVSLDKWLNWLERENARDYDDLIRKTKRLLTNPDSSVIKAIQEQYELLIIDEFQDTDRDQWKIASAIASFGPGAPKTSDTAPENTGLNSHDVPQIFIVGDPKQSIYQFRGADVNVWNEVAKEFESNGLVLHLSKNFRSDPKIVKFVNSVAEKAFDETGVIKYQKLHANKAGNLDSRLEWIPSNGDLKSKERIQEEAELAAQRIKHLLDHGKVVDDDHHSPRKCRPEDIGVLAHRNIDILSLEEKLKDLEIKFFNTATKGLNERQEILDLVTALHLTDNRFDDLHAFAFLRSPFVGLRDEVLVRIGLYEIGNTSSENTPTFLQKAEAFLEKSDQGTQSSNLWFDAPESDEIADIERTALRRGLAALREAHSLANRVDHAQVLEGLLTASGYRLHLLVRDNANEALANIDRFLVLLDKYRGLPLKQFLNHWELWTAADSDSTTSQARLHSSAEDVVTISTIHSAKGLEWPVVILIGTHATVPKETKLQKKPWVDPDLGPIHLPKKREQDLRAKKAVANLMTDREAEAARLFYVALTRAKSHLAIVAPTPQSGEEYEIGFNKWLHPELKKASETYQTDTTERGEETDSDSTRPTHSEVEDEGTGTGKQIDVFESEVTDDKQLGLDFSSQNRVPKAIHSQEGLVIVRLDKPSKQLESFEEAPVKLEWLSQIEATDWPHQTRQIEVKQHRLVTSATELMMKAKDLREWERRYLHGVFEEDDYFPVSGGVEQPSGRIHGTIIHGVLERIRAVEEIGRIIEETISSLDLPDLPSIWEVGSSYRLALEEEISRVVSSPEWHWYVEGEHSRELPFMHLSKDGWIKGEIDLYRPRSRESTASGQVSLFENSPFRSNEETSWVIDFKTHDADAAKVDTIANDYAIQAQVYREAATALGRDDQAPRVALHFTNPNVVVEI